MPQTKAMRRAELAIDVRPYNISIALRDLRQARDILRDCGSKAAADYVARAMKSAEGAHRHAERMANEYASSIRVAYCNANGLIEFGRIVPDGCLSIARGPEPLLRELIEPEARHGYRTRKVRGRPTKIPGTDCLLVPGIPEAPNQSAGLEALRIFIGRLRRYKAGHGAVVFGAAAA